MKAVIMAAGKSTRTYPLTLTRPKPLLKLLNRPSLARQLDALCGTVDGVVLVVGYKQEMIRAAFGDRYEDLAIEYVEQTEQRGTGHAVLQCAPLLDEPFLAMNGDDLYAAEDLARLAKAGQAALTKEVDDPKLYGIYELTDGDRVVRLVEKPVEIFSHIANIGAYKFTPEVFDALKTVEPSPRGEIEITCAIQLLAEQGDFRVVPIRGYWLPIGYPWHLLDAGEFLFQTQFNPRLEGEVSPAAHLSGPVAVGKGTVVRTGAVIEGPVCIGRNCTIGPNCYLRGGTVIGDNCRIGQSVEIKNSVLMDRVHVSHLSYIGDSVIGEGANMGCGTVTANVRHDGGNVGSTVNGKLVDSGRRKLGTVIGDGVHTGINTSIYPGRKLWPHTSTRPGQAVDRDITE
ncbi:MAG: UDP-N-acetylglucosamine diphosphorylase / glucose-phosphate thymidylyltransferase [Candidatus Hydrogenedentes bacterium]|nr:UDP-N-acetylglucosamine diphosphorylase / glucose-phosphate thymidylyltransferase [Candidatus Hydrogenedentota bacterium]